MALSLEYANRLLNQTFSGSSYKVNSTYVALFSTPATFSGSGTEVTGAAYARVGVHPGTGWAAVSSGTTSNVASVVFPAATTGSFGTVYGWGIFDADTGGMRICQSSLNTPVTVNSGDQFSFPPGSLQVSFFGSCSNMPLAIGLEYLDVLAKLTFNNSAAMNVSSIAVALYTAVPTYSSSGTEVSGGSYARVTMPRATAWTAASGALVRSNSACIFTAATADWGTVNGFAIFASSATFPTSGQTMRAFQGSIGPALAVQSGDTVSFAPTDIFMTLVASC